MPDPRVHIGLQACQGPDGSLWHGIGRVARDLTVQLLNDHPGLIAGLHIDRALPVPRTLADFCGDGLIYQHPTTRELPLDPGDGRTLVYHVISPFWPVGPLRELFPPPFVRAGAKLAVTLYDLIPLILQDPYLADPSFRRWYVTRLKFIEDADLILAISRATRDDAVRMLGLDPDLVKVVYLGVNEFFRPPDVPREATLDAITRRLSAIVGPYLFYPAGSGQFRKNIDRAIDTYARLSSSLRQRLQLVISGNILDHDKTGFLEKAVSLGVDDRLVFTGSVDDETLKELYQAAELCLYPSLYEGFGLPILEAMRCGVPVVTSNCSSMKEVMEVDEARFDPEDVADMARVIERPLVDEAFRRQLLSYGTERSRQFTWKSAARETADAYRQLAPPGGVPSRARPPRRRQIAISTPFPPDQSGVADYNRRLLEVLCARHPVQAHVVVRGEPLAYQAGDLAQLIPISVQQFSWLAKQGYYDSIIHCMGNSPHHGYIYELIKEHPGTVWLHDIRLTDFYRWYYQEHLGRDIGRLPDELLTWASRYPAYRGDVLLRDNVSQHQQGIYLAGEVASCAQRLIVGSRFSRGLLEVESQTDVPITIIPLAAQGRNGPQTGEGWRELAARYRLAQDAVPIISTGIVWLTKRPEIIIEAFAEVASDNPALILAFVGPCDDGYRRQLEHRASRLGIRDRVVFTGYIDEAELDAWLQAAPCAVQLRFPTNGESSWTVMRCLAAGVPTIVSDHGPLREIPDDAVLKVAAQVEPDQLADAMRDILSHENIRNRLRHGALRYAQEMSLEAVADRLWAEVLCAQQGV